MFVNNLSQISRTHVSKSKTYFNVKSSKYYFHEKTNILADFKICVSVPLSTRNVLVIVSNSLSSHKQSSFLKIEMPFREKLRFGT